MFCCAVLRCAAVVDGEKTFSLLSSLSGGLSLVYLSLYIYSIDYLMKCQEETTTERE